MAGAVSAIRRYRQLASLLGKTPPPLNSNAPFAIRARVSSLRETGDGTLLARAAASPPSAGKIVNIQGFTDAFDV
jgi:hypothetical protein